MRAIALRAGDIRVGGTAKAVFPGQSYELDGAEYDPTMFKAQEPAEDKAVTEFRDKSAPAPVKGRRVR